MTTKVPGFKVPFIKFFVYKKSEDGLGEFETYESAIAYAKERLKENRGIASIEVYGKVDTSTLKEVESKSSRNTYYRVEDIFVDGYEKVLGLPMKIIISGHAID